MNRRAFLGGVLAAPGAAALPAPVFATGGIVKPPPARLVGEAVSESFAVLSVEARAFSMEYVARVFRVSEALARAPLEIYRREGR